MAIREFCRGRWGAVVFATLDDESCPASAFLSSDGARERVKLAALFQRFADHGYITNREKFKKIAPDLYEFKGHQVRMFCYIEGRTVTITHGAIKKRDTLNPADIERAKRIREQHQAAQVKR